MKKTKLKNPILKKIKRELESRVRDESLERNVMKINDSDLEYFSDFCENFEKYRKELDDLVSSINPNYYAYLGIYEYIRYIQYQIVDVDSRESHYSIGLYLADEEERERQEEKSGRRDICNKKESSRVDDDDDLPF